MKEFIEKAFGIKDSELGGWEYNIPEGMEATIVDNKIVVKKKESENDRIRKSILTGLIDCRDAPDLGWSDFGGIPIEDCIAWFEKQGEQKPADKVKSKFHEGEQKSTWSEEDERLCSCLIEEQEEALDNVKNSKYGHSEIISDLKEMYNERIDWLKSLKDRVQSQWKPSEEQMKSLSLATQCVYAEEDIKNLNSLYEQLKKL